MLDAFLKRANDALDSLFGCNPDSTGNRLHFAFQPNQPTSRDDKPQQPKDQLPTMSTYSNSNNLGLKPEVFDVDSGVAENNPDAIDHHDHVPTNADELGLGLKDADFDYEMNEVSSFTFLLTFH